MKQETRPAEESEFQKLLSGLLAQHVREVSALQNEVLRLQDENEALALQRFKGGSMVSIDLLPPEEKQGDENEAFRSLKGGNVVSIDQLPPEEKQGDENEAFRSLKGGNVVSIDQLPSEEEKGAKNEALQRLKGVSMASTDQLPQMKGDENEENEARQNSKGGKVVSINLLPLEEKMVDESDSLPSEELSEGPISPKSPKSPKLGLRKQLTLLLETLDEDLPEDEFAGERDVPSDVERSQSSCLKKLHTFLQSNKFEFLISVLLCVNVLFLALELQYHGNIEGYYLSMYETPYIIQEDWGQVDSFFVVGDLVFTVIFCIDVTIRIVVLRSKFWYVPINWVDFAVVATSLIALAESLPVSPLFLRLLRIGKLARALRMVTTSNALMSLKLLIKCLASSLDMLFWSFMLLVFIQCIAGMVIANLAKEYISDTSKRVETRREVFIFYGTFTRTFLTMFEILFANWAPACRVLVDNVSEWFSIFFLIYRCVIGFAVLNVLNAVFIQQTLKTASSDEELAFKQKQKDHVKYTQKVQKLFRSVDLSSDGNITFDEFALLVESPKLKFWMSQLELEYHDLLGLFEMLDDGDGEISLEEFITGAGRLKGTATTIDIWRLETKLEIMLTRILANTSGDSPGEQPDLEELFKSSGWSHMPVSAVRSLSEGERSAERAYKSERVINKSSSMLV